MNNKNIIENFKHAKSIEQLRKIKKESLIITLILIAVLVGISEGYDFVVETEKTRRFFAFHYIPVLFCQILPTIYMILSKKKGELNEVREMKKCFILLFYYLIFLQVINFILDWNGVKIQRYVILKMMGVVNIGLLGYSISRIFKYVFLDVILKKRKIAYSDLKYVFLSYIGIGITFGYIYYMIAIIYGKNSFNGYIESGNVLVNYFQFIYFSFITLATVGYGEMTPALIIGKLVVIIEIISGVALINLILAIVIGAGLFNQKD